MTTGPKLPGWRHAFSGKVRDLYLPASGPSNVMLVVASDRISAFDHILPTTIPDKGAILTQLSVWWYGQLTDIVGSHLMSLEVPPEVAGRAMIVRRLEMYPVEAVARGYLAGSGLADYRATGTICGVPLPAGLAESAQLPEAIFTPSTKADIGDHDENVTFEDVAAVIGLPEANELRDVTLRLYRRAHRIAAAVGIILADTKFEFGVTPGGELLLADEALTPDSSRFWDGARWQVGQPAPSFDKQFVRDWLTSPASGWDRSGSEPPPPLPDEVVAATRDRYLDAFRRLTGTDAVL